jgi:Fe(3+) dicitrate transport protein
MRPSRVPLMRCCVAIVLALLPTVIQAQTPPPADSVKAGVVVLPVIEVIGRSPGSILRHTGTVHILDREDMQIFRPISTEDALRRLPGINTKSEEETAIVSNIGLRGLASSEAKSLMLEDGVPVAPGLLIGNDRYFNPRIQRVERIEVLKGSASLRYGPRRSAAW